MQKQECGTGKKKVLIHIGMGRCGTSVLQHALSISRSDLARKRILYPETNPAHHAQHGLGILTNDQAINAVEKWRDVLDEFEKSECDTILVSTENFIGIPTEPFEAIKRMLSGYFVKIIFITRNQTELLPSIYAQWTKAGIVFRSFRHFYQVTKQEWHFNEILERWSIAYGKENIMCKVLEPKGDAVKAFSACCGDGDLAEILAKTQLPRGNMSINSKLLLILVLFDRFNSWNKIGSVFPGWNRIEPSRPDRNADIRGKLVQFLEIYSARWCKGSGSKLTKSIEAEIAAEYQETNERFHVEYLGCEPQNWFIKK